MININNGISISSGDLRYLKLDCSNDPLTNTLNGANALFTGTLGAGAITGTSYVGLTFTMISAIQWSGTILQKKTIVVTNGVVGLESAWSNVDTN